MAKTKHIAVLGGGASGIAAALEAARAGASVVLFEAAARIGGPILASGNGRCNFSNAMLTASAYHNADFVARAFAELPPERVLAWFSELGLLYREEAEGRLYPCTNKAPTVLDVLRFALDEAGVRVECGCVARSVEAVDRGFTVRFADGATRSFDAVLIGVGGVDARDVAPGHQTVPLSPRLCALQTDTARLKGLDNVRVRCVASLLSAGGTQVAQGEGEVLFRSYGVSGIVIFDLSRFAEAGMELALDLVPALSVDQLADALALRAAAHPGRDIEGLCTGIVLPTVARAAARQAHLRSREGLPADGAQRLASALKDLRLPVRGLFAKNAQIHRGGICVAAIDPQTMESRVHAGLYVMGEALDVDAPCGGYNLHWAWTSGILAGRSAAR